MSKLLLFPLVAKLPNFYCSSFRGRYMWGINLSVLSQNEVEYLRVNQLNVSVVLI